jgi:hypothetical protein
MATLARRTFSAMATQGVKTIGIRSAYSRVSLIRTLICSTTTTAPSLLRSRKRAPCGSSCGRSWASPTLSPARLPSVELTKVNSQTSTLTKICSKKWAIEYAIPFWISVTLTSKRSEKCWRSWRSCCLRAREEQLIKERIQMAKTIAMEIVTLEVTMKKAKVNLERQGPRRRSWLASKPE